MVPNGVDRPRLAGRRRERSPRPARRFAGDGPLVGFAGRLVYEKGVQDLIAAVPRLRAAHPGLRVVIAGDGPYRAELQAEARRLRLTARSASPASSAERAAARCWRATDCVVVPSIYEPFGMVALEARRRRRAPGGGRHRRAAPRSWSRG